jgi:histidyl-tRNA synthetase
LYSAHAPSEHLVALKKQLVDTGHTVRLVATAKNMRPVFERLVIDGFARVAEVGDDVSDAHSLAWRDLG